MSALADQPTASPGLTSPLEPPPDLPSADAAREFYLYGAVVAANVFVTNAFDFNYRAMWTPSSQTYWTSTAYTQRNSRLTVLLRLVADELRRLRQLRPGWDGYRAVPVTEAAVYGAASLLGRLLDADSEPPQIFPLNDGGLQVEWYAGGDEIDIDVDRTGMAHVLATKSGGLTLVEGSFDPSRPGQAISDLAKYVREFSIWIAEERKRG